MEINQLSRYVRCWVITVHRTLIFLFGWNNVYFLIVCYINIKEISDLISSNVKSPEQPVSRKGLLVWFERNLSVISSDDVHHIS